MSDGRAFPPVDLILPQARILVVDDEDPLRHTLAGYLRHVGYQVVEAASGLQALAHLRGGDFDLVILDLKMPGMEGTEVLATARPLAPDTIFIILTAYGTLDSSIVAIRHGAFDYLLKPTSMREIVQTVRRGLIERKRRLSSDDPVALLERALDTLKTTAGRPEPSPAPERFLQGAGIALDTLKQVVVVRGDPVELTSTEFEILCCLMRHRDRVLSCREIVGLMHGDQLDERDARLMLRSHIHRLRQKIEEQPSRPRLVCTVRGSGYTFAAG